MNQLLHWLTAPEWAHVVAALLHSLWQGAIVALILAALMRRLSNPLTRYRCVLSALGVISIAAIVTWAVLNAPNSAPHPITAKAIEPTAPAIIADAIDSNPTDKVVVIGQMTRPEVPTNWTAWLALTWMAGAMIMLLRAGVKVAGAEKLRRSCQPLADEPITLLVAEACRAVGLARKIRVAVTEKITSPAVVGVLVPTLILPLSLFTTLTPTQIQFVLLHELAHIRRGDYLANLFQLFAEALLFFNPAVWWISHQIRREREACCDALAIELSGAPADYARTLLYVAENILQPTPSAAPAFGDDGREPSSLADRVQRLLVPGYRPALRLTWRSMVTSLLIGSALLVCLAVGTRNTVGAILISNQAPAKASTLLPASNLTNSTEQNRSILSYTDASFPSEPTSKATGNVAIQVLGGSSYSSIEADGEIIIATNGAVVKFANQELTADFIHINQTTGEVTARGNVHLETTNAVFTSQSLVWNTISNQFSGIYDNIHFKSPFLMESQRLGAASVADTNEVYRASKLQPSNSILTEPQFRGVLKAIEQRTGVKILTENPITIASNREAQIRATQINLNNPAIYSSRKANAATNKTPAEPLATRTFNVDVNALYAAARKAGGLPETTSLSNLHAGVRTFFAQAGVNLDPQLGRSMFFSDSRGDMFVRATKDELDIIEKLLKPLAGIPLSRGNFQITPQTLADARSSLPPAINSILATNPAAGFRALLESFDPTDPRPKRVQFNPASGELLVRATEADLQKFASALKVARMPMEPVQFKSSVAQSAPPELATRTFVVGPMELAKALGRTGPLSVTNIAEMVSACLAKAGLDLQPPKSVFFKNPLSLLLVRATSAELDALEKFLARANRETTSAPPQTNIAAHPATPNPTASSTKLYPRTFAVDMNALTQALTQRLGTNAFFPDKPDEMKWPSALRQLFTSLGVDLKLPKSLYLNDRKGELFVRATQADLDAIETFLQVLNYQAPQVNIKVWWIEIPKGTDLISLLHRRGTNAVALPVFRAQKLRGILTEAQTDEILQRLRQDKRLTLISEGQITTLSARQAQLQVAEVKTIMTGIRPEALTLPGVVATNTPAAAALNAEVVPLGPVLDVTPCVSSDQNQISLHIEASTKEFLGYDQKAPTVLVYINGKKSKTTLPLPKFLVRQMTNDCVLRDGQTLVLGHLPTTEIATQPDGTIQRTDLTDKTNNLCVLVTATLIDPAGNRLNPSK